MGVLNGRDFLPEAREIKQEAAARRVTRRPRWPDTPRGPFSAPFWEGVRAMRPIGGYRSIYFDEGSTGYPGRTLSLAGP